MALTSGWGKGAGLCHLGRFSSITLPSLATMLQWICEPLCRSKIKGGGGTASNTKNFSLYVQEHVPCWRLAHGLAFSVASIDRMRE